MNMFRKICIFSYTCFRCRLWHTPECVLKTCNVGWVKSHCYKMLKGRKVSGRGEAVTTNYAFSPLDDDIIIKHRLPWQILPCSSINLITLPFTCCSILMISLSRAIIPHRFLISSLPWVIPLSLRTLGLFLTSLVFKSYLPDVGLPYANPSMLLTFSIVSTWKMPSLLSLPAANPRVLLLMRALSYLIPLTIGVWLVHSNT